MLQLLLDGVHQLPAAQSQFIKTGQDLDCFRYFLALPGLGQPVNHIQGIIEKMRINLGLKGAEFRHPKLIRSLFLAVHQADDFFCHVVVGIGEHANLVAARVSHIHGLGRPCAHGFHLQGHAYDAVRNGTRQTEGSVQGQGSEQQVNQGKMHHQRPACICDMEGRNNGHHIPVRVRYGKIGNISGTVQIGDKGKRLFLPYPLLQIRAGNEVFPGQAHI